MFDVGRVCLKIAGRDAGKKCVVVEKLEGKYVLIDGMTRRKKCNTLHLEPLDQMIDVGDGNHSAVAKAFKDLGFEVTTTKAKSKTQRPSAIRKVKQKPVENPKAKKKTEKAEKKPKAEPVKKAEKKE